MKRGPGTSGNVPAMQENDLDSCSGRRASQVRAITEDSFKFSTTALQDETPAQQTSVRSIVVGGLVGFMLFAGSMYLSFKSGNSMSSSIFVAVIGFSMCSLPRTPNCGPCAHHLLPGLPCRSACNMAPVVACNVPHETSSHTK